MIWLIINHIIQISNSPFSVSPQKYFKYIKNDGYRKVINLRRMGELGESVVEKYTIGFLIIIRYI